MYDLEFEKDFIKAFSKIKNKVIRKQIYSKLKELKLRVPIGKKLHNNIYWSLKVNQYRIIYKFDNKIKIVFIINILNRKNDYKELD